MPVNGKKLCTPAKRPDRRRRRPNTVQRVQDDLPLVLKRPGREVHSLPRLRMSGTISLRRPYAFTAFTTLPLTFTKDTCTVHVAAGPQQLLHKF